MHIESGIDDTTLLLPVLVERFGNGIAVADVMGQRVVHFGANGQQDWSVGREGRGPAEFRGINQLYVEDSTLVVVDSSNRRISRLSQTGELLEETPVPNLPVWPWAWLDLGDSTIVLFNNRERAIYTLKGPELTPTNYQPFLWFEPIPETGSVAMRGAAHPSSPKWVGALIEGPGFILSTEEGISEHLYPDSIPFTVGDRGAPRDWGATGVDATEESFYLLYGGRPKRQLEPEGVAPRRIDQYSWDAVLQRTYMLPGGAAGFATDGTTFVLVRTDPRPAVLVLAPAVAQR